MNKNCNLELKERYMMGNYFGTDGVRGIANEELTPELAFKLGRAGGYVLTKDVDKPKVLIGKDTRISGDMLEGALIAGLLSIGTEVMRLGVISTPGVAYLTRVMNADVGIMISASHNRSEERRVGKEGRSRGWRWHETKRRKGVEECSSTASEERVRRQHCRALFPYLVLTGRCGRRCLLFFFSSRRRHTRWPRDWSSDVCSSDLYLLEQK